MYALRNWNFFFRFHIWKKWGLFFFCRKRRLVHNFFEHRQNCGRSAHLGVYVMSIFNALKNQKKKKSSQNQSVAKSMIYTPKKRLGLTIEFEIGKLSPDPSIHHLIPIFFANFSLVTPPLV